MDKCPYCGAETRPGDNFCLNCGNRLLPATPNPPQQAQSGFSDATVAESNNWSQAEYPGSVGNSWNASSGANAPTVASSEPVVREAAQATMDRVSQPARFVLRSDNGEDLQDYPLDKPEIVIGRAPNSDILLSKDKLTSRRHATVFYDDNQYVLRDEHSANGTFVNGQQLEEGAMHNLVDGDHVGIGEHELVFQVFGSSNIDVEDLPTVAVGYDPERQEMTYRTQEDALQTAPADDEYNTTVAEEEEPAPVVVAEQSPVILEAPSPASAASTVTSVDSEPEQQSDVVSGDSPNVAPIPEKPAYNSSNAPVADSGEATFNRFNALSVPTLPDMSALMAALSAFDGQVTTLQEQFNATQEAFSNHNRDVSQTANQLRSGIRRVSDRMDNMIADVARSREALAWAELLQLMEDVMNNPRDIEYVTKLARKARELNKVFQIHQNVLNTMAECNSLLRSMIGE